MMSADKGRREARRPFARERLDAEGFLGFISFRALRETALHEVPKAPGVYVVLWDRTVAPRFLKSSVGGRFKGQDPTVEVTRLRMRWVEDSGVVYVGKAKDLRRRPREFAAFGTGKPVGHWGGRLIWQLENSQDLLVAWKLLSEGADPREEERRLLRAFRELHGVSPYANIAD